MTQIVKKASENSTVDELSLKQLVLRLNELIGFLWKKKFIIMVFSLLGGGAGLLFAYLSPVKYKGELTFVVEENGGGAMGAYAGLASQFGIDLGGMGGGNGAFSGDNIIGLLQSRMLIEKALLVGSVEENGKKISLADLFLRFSGMKKKWAKANSTALINLTFPINSDRSKFTLLQDSVLNIIQNTVNTKMLKVEKPDKKMSFVSVTCLSSDETFSKVFVENLVSEAISLYIDTKTARNKGNVNRLQDQADSLERQLNRKTYAAAQTQDLNTNPAKQIAMVTGEVAMRDKLVLQTMYAEVIKNLELGKLAMAQETPMIQIVDKPIYPLNRQRFSKAICIVIGGVLAGVLSSVFLVLKFELKKLMA
ncbi:Chain length determinant protein [Chitinophaga terrae (ex Kim and Jung 2007)]|uniref:Chain length determinant protein n=1 Tax=Chitinophaga terrae (ex Kim and Jung 2007) TaxID=408074 RepID=A0A1H3XZ04_9BACT|nr:Wzz/FepE/Etk N-terminal domain-containing protein [Chitinophaga terrae (ex Kim and Jung 2007)]GEP89441.1 hypothetical protein CTE07_10860 [Chitinophaga terrae (ex Kim and Jung 2007)]SEA03788.1 Chain length determinant protein [Chitinophaga terrae (ex Kim and Jung 2007)]